MSTLTEQKSFSDFLIETTFKAISSNTVGTGFNQESFIKNVKDFNWDNDVVQSDLGMAFSNSAKVLGLMIFEELVKTFSDDGKQAFVENFKKNYRQCFKYCISIG